MTSTSGKTVAVLLAAGSSLRMDGIDKPWVDLAGEPLLLRPLRMLAAVEEVDAIVVVAPAAHHAELYRLGTSLGRQVTCVEGGRERQDSVAAALAAAPEASWYLVHDAARPLASSDLARRLLRDVRARGAVIPGVAVVDTVKRIDASGRVVETHPRHELRAIQTPQAFEGDLLRRAHSAPRPPQPATDDALLVELLGVPVYVVDGEPHNIKVTTPDDLERVRASLGTSTEAPDARR